MRPDVVCICGSARFFAEIQAANREMTLKGVIVLAPSETGEAPTPEQKAVLDVLHFHRIDLADRILVVNPGGYIGQSTQREIAHARALGKPVVFTEPPSSVDDPASPSGVCATAARRQRIAAYAVLTDRQDRILMVRAAAEDSGRWYLPGGGVEFGEDPEAGLRREVAEETGQVVADLRLDRVLSDVGVHRGAGLHSVRIIYRGTLAGERPLRNEAPGGSTVQVRWIPRHDVPGLDTAPFVLEALRALSSQ